MSIFSPFRAIFKRFQVESFADVRVDLEKLGNNLRTGSGFLVQISLKEAMELVGR